MARYPGLSVPGLLRLSDYVGTASFAVTGSLLAAGVGADLLGCAVIGTTTAVGGGTVRDLLLGNGRRAFWMEEVEYLYISLAAAVAAFLLWPAAERGLGLGLNDAWLEATDALGVGAFCVIGAMNGLRAGVPPVAAVVCGVVTATFGGAIRDVLCERPVRILHSYASMYATAAAGGATIYVLVRLAGLPTPARILAGVFTGMALRAASEHWDLRLPVYDSDTARQTAAAKGDHRGFP